MSAPNIVINPDFHSRYDLLEHSVMVEPDAEHWLVGDFIDGGSGSALETMNFLYDNQDNVHSVLANHEYMARAAMEATINREYWADMWLNCGGINTALDYGVAVQNRLSQNIADDVRQEMERREHLALLQAMPFIHTIGGVVIVHAGVENGLRLHEQISMLNARHKKTIDAGYFGFDKDDIPRQLASHGRASNTLGHPDASVVVSGHSHADETVDERLTDAGKRARLASKITNASSFIVWRNSDGLVHKLNA